VVLECEKVRRATTGRSWQDGKGVAQLAVMELLKGRGRWLAFDVGGRPPDHNTLAGLVTLLHLSRTTSWSSSAAATSLKRVPPGLYARPRHPSQVVSYCHGCRLTAQFASGETGESYVNSSLRLYAHTFQLSPASKLLEDSGSEYYKPMVSFPRQFRGE